MTRLRLLACLTLAASGVARAQGAFVSGSTGVDGALRYVDAPDNRLSSAIAFDSQRGVAVLFGGQNRARALFGDTWEWDGARWQLRSVSPSPAPRSRHALAFDAARGVTLLFGGDVGQGGMSGDAAIDDTWTWNGTHWVLQTPPGERPSPRYSHGLAYDSDRNVVVLFGGFQTGVGFLADTWEWDGVRWNRLLPAHSPSPRATYAMAYDRARGRVLLFGGEDSQSFRGDTWEWDGVDWSERPAVNAPTARRAHAVAYDAGRQRVVLFGGTDGSPMVPKDVADTWEWNGSSWELRQPASAPSPRRRLVLAYDAARQQTLLFGGAPSGAGAAPFGDTWLWNGTTWSQRVDAQGEPIFDISSKPDGVFGFTTIDIGPGVVVRFARNAANTPLTWLASGNVNIAGVLELNGVPGGPNVDPGNEATGVAGGFAGGRGGKRSNASGTFAGTAGQGLGGGRPGASQNQVGGNAGFATAGSMPLGGLTYGNDLLQPLSGGSGGGGGGSSTTVDGGNGGAGGGAILIASSGTIRVDGSIQANGGRGQPPMANVSSSQGGHGSGGSIRLVANRIEGGGALSARNGNNSATEGLGRIRTEAFVVGLTTLPQPPNVSGPPLGVALPNAGQIRIVSVAGQPVPQPPGGSTIAPDVVFDQAGFAAINLATTNIPMGTVITVRVTTGGQVITVASTPTDASGNAVASVEVPAGVGTIQAFADYVPAR